MIILHCDYNLYKTGNSYPYSVYRLDNDFMKLVEKLDIASDTTDILKKSILSEQLLKKLNFTISEDVHSIFTTLIGKKTDSTNILTNNEYSPYREKNSLYFQL
jgi:hypothetical protein